MVEVSAIHFSLRTIVFPLIALGNSAHEKYNHINMKRADFSFDWRAFSYTLLALTGVIGALSGTLYGVPYAQAYFSPKPAAPIAFAEKPVELPTQATTSLATLFSTSSARTISPMTIEQAIPAHGKFIAADLTKMKLYLYQDGTSTATYQILTKGKPGSAYETPAGSYTIQTKETDHLNKAEAVHMPYSMEFYGNYFIHGWPVYVSGKPVASTYSGGCIRLSTLDAAKVFAFADTGVNVFVYDTGSATTTSSIPIASIPIPDVSAGAYLVADVDTGDIYAEHDATSQRPIASVTKLMTTLVANETIMFDQKITVPHGKLKDTLVATDTVPETFAVGDLLYPLLMESNNNIADTLAQHYGTDSFVVRMNEQAKALNMASTTYVDASGVSRNNVSTTEDLYRLAVYLANKKSFVWNITRTPEKTIVADDHSQYTYENFNEFSNLATFIGGKVGHTAAAKDTMVSVFNVPLASGNHRVAIVVLGSLNFTTDTKALADWFDQSASEATAAMQTACASCKIIRHYEKISL